MYVHTKTCDECLWPLQSPQPGTWRCPGHQHLTSPSPSPLPSPVLQPTCPPIPSRCLQAVLPSAWNPRPLLASSTPPEGWASPSGIAPCWLPPLLGHLQAPLRSFSLCLCPQPFSRVAATSPPFRPPSCCSRSCLWSLPPGGTGSSIHGDTCSPATGLELLGEMVFLTPHNSYHHVVSECWSPRPAMGLQTGSPNTKDKEGMEERSGPLQVGGGPPSGKQGN